MVLGFYDTVRIGPLHRSQDGRQFEQGVAADDRLDREAQPTTRGRLKHPRRDLERSTIPLLLKTTPTHGVPLLDEPLVDDDRTAEPGVPRITDFS
jgi:hypothetical protein